MNKNGGYHVTVVDNKTGETVSDFDTRAIVYVMLNEIDEEKEKKEHGTDLSCKFSTFQFSDRIGLHELLAITNGLQILRQEIIKERPELEILAPLFRQRTTHPDDKED